MAEIGLGEIGDEIAEYLEEMRKEVGKAVEFGLDKAAKIAIRELELSSPKRTGRYAKGWYVAKPLTGGQYLRHRYIRNMTTVKREGREVPLASILEYSRHGRPHIAKARRRIRSAVHDAIQEAIEKYL